jgi:nucleotide-binding universal stress UspA family protein
MRILIALDTSPRSVDIVQHAASRPWPPASEFLLLHVLDPFPFGKAPISLARAKQSAEALLQEFAKPLLEAGWKVCSDVVLGRPRQAISKIAESWKANLVLVSSNDPSALTRLLLGSTARAVLRHAPCSVEIARPKSGDSLDGYSKQVRILVATDGSEFSKSAVCFVAKYGWPKSTQVRVIAFPEPFMPLGEFPNFELKEIEDLNTVAIKEAQRYAEESAAVLRDAGVEVITDTPLPRESDAREIVNEARRWNADIVVVGSHGRRGFDRLTLGSVSEHVALHAHCSVQVIRAPEARESLREKGETS